jgi:hypothetical protein
MSHGKKKAGFHMSENVIMIENNNEHMIPGGKK